MATREKLDYNKQYKKDFEKRVLVSFFPKDKVLYDHVCAQENKSAYIRSLIMKDLGLSESDLVATKKPRVDKPLPDQRTWASIQEACELIGLSRQRLYVYIKNGDLVTRKVKNRTQVKRSSIKKFISSKQ